MTIPETVSYGHRKFKRAEVEACMEQTRRAIASGVPMDAPSGPRDLALRYAAMKYFLKEQQA